VKVFVKEIKPFNLN